MFSKICRLCLVHSPVCFSILEKNIVPMLEALLFKTVTFNEETSDVVCLKCLLNLKLSYKFQQQIKKCEDKLQIRVKQEQEPLTLQTENVIINAEGVVKRDETFQDLLTIYNKCIICGATPENTSINEHIKSHFNRKHLLQPLEIAHSCINCGAKFRYKQLFETHTQNVCSTEQITETSLSTLGLQSRTTTIMLSRDKTKRKRKALSLTDALTLKGVANEVDKQYVMKLGLQSTEAIKTLLGTEKGKVYYCNVCFKKFSNKKTLQCHTHKTKKCQFCDKQVSKYTFNKHVEDHTLGQQVCHLCGATLQNKSSLTTHIFYKHNNLRYKCEECDKWFKKKNARDLHMRKDHLGKPSHYCDICGKGFYGRVFLQKHIKMRHMKLRPHICDFCKKGFSSQYALKTHRRQHTNETPYRCEICGEGFRQNVSLKAHKKSKHNIVEPNICDCKVCGKGFASEWALHAHMRLH